MNNTKQIIISVIGTVTKVVIAVIIIMWVIKNASAAYELGFRIFGEEAVDDEPGYEITLDVDKSSTLEELGDKLEEEGLIRDSFLFQVQGKLAKLDKGIDPGEYNLSSAMTVEEMIGILAQGKDVELKDDEDNEAEIMDTIQEDDIQPADPMDEEGEDFDSMDDEDAGGDEE